LQQNKMKRQGNSRQANGCYRQAIGLDAIAAYGQALESHREQ